jgi:hypothetical protein
MTPEYLAGYDAGKNGPNENNSHFKWFATPEQKGEWERGKAAGERGDQLATLNPAGKNVLTQEEVMATILALDRNLEELKGTLADPKINWNPESRVVLGEIITASQGAFDKLTKLAEMGQDLHLAKYDFDPKTDPDKFFTKES